MNTQLSLMYRDASNYKLHLDVVLSGTLSNSDIAEIRSKLVDGQFVIAHQVGLPTPSVRFASRYSFPTEDDHVYTTLADFEDEDLDPAALAITTDETPLMSCSDFMERVRSVVWDEGAEMRRLGMV